MNKSDESAVVRWVVGIIGGSLVFVVVALVVGFPLRNMFEGVEPLDTIIGFLLPLAIAFYFGYRSFRKSVWPNKPEPPKAVCPKCGYNLKGNVSGICPECGSTAAEKRTGSFIDD